MQLSYSVTGILLDFHIDALPSLSSMTLLSLYFAFLSTIFCDVLANSFGYVCCLCLVCLVIRIICLATGQPSSWENMTFHGAFGNVPKFVEDLLLDFLKCTNISQAIFQCFSGVH